jgi:hypothetical protein
LSDELEMPIDSCFKVYTQITGERAMRLVHTDYIVRDTAHHFMHNLTFKMRKNRLKTRKL